MVADSMMAIIASTIITYLMTMVMAMTLAISMQCISIVLLMNHIVLTVMMNYINGRPEVFMT